MYRETIWEVDIIIIEYIFFFFFFFFFNSFIGILLSYNSNKRKVTRT